MGKLTITQKQIKKLLAEKNVRHPDDDEIRFDTEKVAKDIVSISALASTIPDSTGVSRALSIGSVSVSVFSLSKYVYDFYKNSRRAGTYTIKVSEDDALFSIAERWLMDSLPEEKKRSLFVHSTISKPNILSNTEDAVSGDTKSVRLLTSYDGTIVQEAEIAGYPVRVSTETPEGAQKKGERSYNSYRKITFTCNSPEARNAVMEELKAQSQVLRTKRPGFYTSRWGGFNRSSDIPLRPMESVILKEGQMERIMEHLHRFLQNEDTYHKIGVPFRTGIMLHGTPGSGKSSTAAVIANELEMDLYYVSLRTVGGDDDLAELAQRIPKNSIVLLEDIDVCAKKATLDRETTDDNSDSMDDVSMSALLNILDGFQSPPGVIFIMTTNRVDALDDAIKRPGRVDLMEHIDELDSYQLGRMVEYYTGNKVDVPVIEPKDKITSAEIVQIVRNHIPDTENATEDIIKFVDEKILTNTLF